ncbi:MAG: hypothetical protein J6A36_04810, partial [Clostridia bacterium]|nr:hypothetical protein [Clostridia bacterium]
EYMEEWVTNQGIDKSTFFTPEKLNANLGGKGTVTAVSYNGAGDSTLTYASNDGNLVYGMAVNNNGQVNVVGEPTVLGETLLSQITPANYGDYVSGYDIDLGIATAGNAFSNGKTPVTDWRIFYKDATNVYLIASDYLPTSKYPDGVFGGYNSPYNGYWTQSSSDTTKLTTSGTITTNNNFLFTKLSNVTNTNKNYQAVATLLDSSKWSALASTSWVDNTATAVIGTPTVEMWMASWNQKYSDTLAFDANATGYQVGLTADSLSNYITSSNMQGKAGFTDTLYYPHGNTSGNDWDSCYGYWLASPSAESATDVFDVYCVGSVGGSSYDDDYYDGVRPVVSLSSGVKGTSTTTDGVTTWTLSN